MDKRMLGTMACLHRIQNSTVQCYDEQTCFELRLKRALLQVLARISYLLQAGVGPAAADSLVKILHAAALGGDDMVSAICNTPGLVRCATSHIP